MSTHEGREFEPDKEFEAEHQQLLADYEKSRRPVNRVTAATKERKAKITFERVMIAAGSIVFVGSVALGGFIGFKAMRGDDYKLSEAQKTIQAAKSLVTYRQHTLAVDRSEIGSACIRNIDLVIDDGPLASLSVPEKISKLQEDPSEACGKTYLDVAAKISTVIDDEKAIADAESRVNTAQDAYTHEVEDGSGSGEVAIGAVVGALVGMYAGAWVASIGDDLPPYDPGPYPAYRSLRS